MTPAANEGGPTSSAIADHALIEAFLRETVGGPIHLVALPIEGPPVGRSFGDDAASAASWAVAENERGRGVFWTVNVTAEGCGKKPTKDNIQAARFVHVDIDPPKNGGALDIDATVAALDALPNPPSIIVGSGSGVQAFWRLDEPTFQKAAVEEANRACAAELGGDDCWNIDRFMRLPGTTNWPTRKKIALGRQPAFATILRADDGVSYPATLVGSWFAAGRGAVASDEPLQRRDAVGPFAILTADDLGLSALDPLRMDIDCPPGRDRSGDALACARGMANRGFSDAQIMGVLINPANAVSAHVLEQRNPQRAAARVIELVREDNSSGEHQAATQLRAPISATPYLGRDPTSIPPRPWIWGRWMLRKTISAIVAPGGVGKSTFIANAAISLSTGRPLLGREVRDRPQRVWLWNLEDDADELHRAIEAAALHHGVLSSDWGDRLYVDSGMEGSGLCTAIEDAGGFKLLEPVFDAITVELIAKQMDVLFVDPFVSSHQVDENHNTKIDAIVKKWGRVATAANCTIVLSHHSRKLAGERVTAEMARGASALMNAARIVLTLNRMQVAEAEQFGIDSMDEMRRYFAVEDDKHNRAPAEKAAWFRLSSVALPNGDNVGALAPWSPPSAFDGVTTDHLRRVQTAIAQGEWRKDPRAREKWAGHAIAQVLGLDMESAAARKRAHHLLKTWTANGVLAEELRRDPTTRQDRPCIIVGRWVDDMSRPPMDFTPRSAMSFQPGSTDPDEISDQEADEESCGWGQLRWTGQPYPRPQHLPS